MPRRNENALKGGRARPAKGKKRDQKSANLTPVQGHPHKRFAKGGGV